MRCWLSDRLLRSAFHDCILLGLAPLVDNASFAASETEIERAEGRFLGWPRKHDDTYLAWNTIWEGREYVYAWCTPFDEAHRGYCRGADRSWYDDIVGHERFEVEVGPEAPHLQRPVGRRIEALRRARVHYFGSCDGELSGLEYVPEIARLLPAVLHVAQADLERVALTVPGFDLHGDVIQACHRITYDALYEKSGLTRTKYGSHLWLLQRVEALHRQFPQHLAGMIQRARGEGIYGESASASAK